MCQRAIALLLLPCVLLMQAAGMGHAHGGMQPAGHASRPHFHLPSAGHSHDHTHDHSQSHSGNPAHEHGHRHGEHDPVGASAEVAEVDSPTEGQRTVCPPRDHDADAIFLASVGLIHGQRFAAGELPADAGLAFPTLAPQLGLAFQPHARSVVAPQRPPQRSLYACPLYIWQRALLI